MVIFSEDTVRLTVMVMATSSSTVPEHCIETANVSVDLGTIPMLDILSRGVGKAASFELSVLMEYDI